MVRVNRTNKAMVTPRSGAAVNSHRLFMAFLAVTIFISAVAAASTGHETAALVIALVAGGSFMTAAFC